LSGDNPSTGILQSHSLQIGDFKQMLIAKNTEWFFVLPLMLAAGCSSTVARSPFDGTWKIVLSKTEQPTKPDVYLLRNGQFQCQTCHPTIDVKADGTDQSITGEECYDTVRVRVLSDRAIEEADKRNGTTMRTLRIDVSPDNKEANFKLTDMCNQKAVLVRVEWLAERVEPAPPEAHVVSGSWRTIKQESASENALLVTLKLAKNSFTFLDPTGQGYSANLDGTQAPFTGGSGKTTVSVKRLETNSVEETDFKDGKVFRRVVFTVAKDGSTMTATITDLPQGNTIQFSLIKHKVLTPR
jgi:hypothetical protein